MSEQNENPVNANRRAILKSIGAGASLVGLSGISSARMSPEVRAKLADTRAMERAAEAFDTDHAVQRALFDHGKSIKEQFAAEDVPLSLDAAEFDEVRTFPDRHDGVPTAHIVAELEDGARHVRLHVLPQADDAFVVEKTDSDVRRFEADGDGPTPAEFCETSSGCSGDVCECVAPTPDCDPNCNGYWEKEECCKYSDGSTSCETLERYCTSDCATC